MGKVGRPPWIPSQEELEKIETLASQGLNQEQIMHCIGVGVSTYHDKKDQYPQLVEALKRGKSKGLAYVTDALLKNVNLGNVTAQIFYLKCQGGWKEAKHEQTDGMQSLLEKVIDKL